jgi:hypothetical protein
VLRTFSNRYRERYQKFFRAKIELYRELAPEGSSLDDIWKGERASDAPALTVYRHFDSASVHRGVLGDLPRTAWVIDYPQFERIYYALVAGFDVFGNVRTSRWTTSLSCVRSSSRTRPTTRSENSSSA